MKLESSPAFNPHASLESERKEVVRVILLQNAEPETLRGQDIRRAQVTRLVLAQKSDAAVNPGQIMPVGGNMYPGESRQKAARREVQEETHLLVGDLQELKHHQKYSFVVNGETRHRDAYFYIGDLYGTRFDAPYPLQNEVDKIASFARLEVGDTKKLFSGESVQGGTMLDSLLLDEEVRASRGTYTDQGDVEAVQHEILTHAMHHELQQKTKILGLLKNRNFYNEFDVDTWNALAHEVRSVSADSETVQNVYTQVEAFWETHIEKLGGTEAVISALRFLEIEHIVDDLDAQAHREQKTTKGIPTLHMMFSVMFGFDFDKHTIAIIESHPHLARVYEVSKALYLYEQMLKEKSAQPDTLSSRYFATKRLLCKLCGLPKNAVPQESDIVSFFETTMDVQKALYDTETFTMLGEQIDMLFADLQKQTQISPRETSLAPKNEVQSKDLERLLHLAFGAYDTKTDMQIRFEAQRKLLLMALFVEVRAFYTNIRKRGIQPLDDLEDSLQKKGEEKLFGGRNERTIVLQDTDASEKDVEYVEYGGVLVDRGIKEIGSLMRKVLVRDEWDFGPESPYNDVYRESYIFPEQIATSMKESVYEVPCEMTDGKDKPITSYTAPKVVHDFIVTLHKKAEASGERLRIRMYKGLPAEGKKMESAGVGGGGAIRMCKFYLEHTDAQDVVRMREVQIFLPKKHPNDTWVSGEADYEAKKKDDTRYSLERLFTHGNAYSVIELLFPYYIYGDRMKALFSRPNGE